MSTTKLIVAGLLTLACLLAMWRGRRRWQRVLAWPILLQPVIAALLYWALYPPALPVPDQQLAVLVGGATAEQRGALGWRQRIVAMPEAKAPPRFQTLPDLATALRRYPQTTTIDVIGDGLALRDQRQAQSRAVQFSASAEQGLVELQAPDQAAQGVQWQLAGRALAPAARVELLDPSGAVADALALPPDGRFRLSASARIAGTARYELRVFDAQQKLVDHAAVPLLITAGERLKVIVRAGAPDPELKYWRRWADDAGIAVQADAALSRDVNLRAGETALTVAALADADLVIVDERSWLRLGDDEKAALRAAVDEGLGLLLRVTGAVPPAVAADWRALGFAVSNQEAPHSVTLDQRSGLRERDRFTVAPVAIASDHASPFLQADDDEVLAAWRSAGRGRIGIWRLVDSYRLILRGYPARYAGLWQAALATLTRARAAEHRPQLPPLAWVNERSLLCGLGAAATVRAADDSSTALLVDQACAAYWPSLSGWQSLQTGAASFPFYVRAADDARGLRAARDRAATLALVHAAATGAAPAMRDAFVPRWPFFLAWLLLAAMIWWRERPA